MVKAPLANSGLREKQIYTPHAKYNVYLWIELNPGLPLSNYSASVFIKSHFYIDVIHGIRQIKPDDMRS